MKVQFASDIHLEFPDNSRWLSENPLQVTGDILVLSGDMLIFGSDFLETHPFIDWCSKNYRYTFLVPGNHEYYNRTDILNTMRDFFFPLRDNVIFCNNHSIPVDDVEFFFTTLWTNVSKDSEMEVQRCMNDCYRIQHGHRFLLARDYKKLHKMCVDWLTKALSESTAKKKVVVTHHCPVDMEDPAFASNGLTEAFIVPMEDYIEQSDIDHWVFGHTHYNAANGMRVGNTVMHTNQVGYVKDGVCKGFDPGAHFEV
ncbi:MAG: metallophosphoesterase [Bacteroidales bacterium]|nr:metallophosphoesterase [Bacteroidales bacterium]